MNEKCMQLNQKQPNKLYVTCDFTLKSATNRHFFCPETVKCDSKLLFPSLINMTIIKNRTTNDSFGIFHILSINNNKNNNKKHVLLMKNRKSMCLLFEDIVYILQHVLQTFKVCHTFID